MTYAGDFTPNVTAYETRVFPIDFSDQLADGEVIVKSGATMEVWYGFDPFASALLLSQSFAGSVVSITCGGISISGNIFYGGFQPGVVYSIRAWALTSATQVLQRSMNIECDNNPAPELPAGFFSTSSGSDELMQIYSLSASATISLPGFYKVLTPGITVTLPSSIGSAFTSSNLVVIADYTESQNPNISIAGPLGNGQTSPMVLNGSGSSQLFVGDAGASQWGLA
jgi:hypothetical protein